MRLSGLRPVVADEQLEVLRMCVDRRASLGREHTRKVSRLHKLLLELIPGGAKRSLSAAQAKGLLRKVRPSTAAGKVRKAHAAELVADLATIYGRSQAADKELKALVKATGTTLLDLQRIGPSGAARLLAEVGDVTRFPDRNHFASWNGSAPIDASSGDHTRHRLSRKGNRQINRGDRCTGRRHVPRGVGPSWRGGYDPNFVHRPSETTSTVPSTTLMAVCSSMA
ncbi:transposase [Ornithinimicrobium sp. LYQ121]|uniref:transposase n=1 Tax=Ornithinimicrobium sp. LYQ121 TaxID=3378801 RepID=UPI003853D3F4